MVGQGHDRNGGFGPRDPDDVAMEGGGDVQPGEHRPERALGLLHLGRRLAGDGAVDGSDHGGNRGESHAERQVQRSRTGSLMPLPRTAARDHGASRQPGPLRGAGRLPRRRPGEPGLPDGMDNHAQGADSVPEVLGGAWCVVTVAQPA